MKQLVDPILNTSYYREWFNQTVCYDTKLLCEVVFFCDELSRCACPTF